MTKLTNNQKTQIISLIKEKENQLGSMRAVATFLDLSPAVISQMINNKYETKGDDAWIDVAAKLGWQPDTDERGRRTWKVVKTMDMKQLMRLLADVKNNSLFVPISDYAGIGKSAILKSIAQQQANNYTYYLRCMDWGKREFLVNLCRTLGIDTGKGHKTPNEYVQMVIDFFRARLMLQPLLIIDEADKLKAGAKLTLIPIYNECEDSLGCVIAGTENLEKEIKRGVQYQTKGYDEIDSRFGRKYIKLIGCTLTETTEICKANGIADEKLISDLFEECKPIRKEVKISNQAKIIRVITDLRRLKRLVQREQLKQMAS